MIKCYIFTLVSLIFLTLTYFANVFVKVESLKRPKTIHITSIAFWQGESKDKLVGHILVPKRIKSHILNLQKHVNHHFPTKLNNCTFCDSDKCFNGLLYTLWGSEEERANDRGVVDLLEKSKLNIKNHRYRTSLSRTMRFTCVLENAPPYPTGGILHLDMFGQYGYSTERDNMFSNVKLPLKFKRLELKVEPRVRSKKTPGFVNCGRQLFGHIDGKFIAKHVSLLKSQGAILNVMYDFGNAQIENRDEIQSSIENGDLVVVKIQDELSMVNGEMFNMSMVDSKGASQWLTRWDCVERVKDLVPDFISFFDLDEYIESDEFKLDKNYDMLKITSVQGDGSYCNMTGFKNKAGNLPGKYFIKPTVPLNLLRVHNFDEPRAKKAGIKIRVKEIHKREAFLRHERCVNKVLSK